jgi:phage gpG-like protein
MVATGFDIKIDGFENLGKLKKSVADFIPKFEPFIKDFYAVTVYITQGAEIGKRWNPRKTGGSWPLLRKTGTMQSNTQTQKDRNKVRVFNDTEYAKYHQFGTRKMQQRSIFGSGGKLVNTIEVFTKTYFKI